MQNDIFRWNTPLHQCSWFCNISAEGTHKLGHFLCLCPRHGYQSTCEYEHSTEQQNLNCRNPNSYLVSIGMKSWNTAEEQSHQICWFSFATGGPTPYSNQVHAQSLQQRTSNIHRLWHRTKTALIRNETHIIKSGAYNLSEVTSTRSLSKYFSKYIK